MNLKISSRLKNVSPRTRLYLRWTVLIVCIVIMIFVMKELNFRYVDGKEVGAQFYTHWMSTRLFLARGMDPYGEEVHQWIKEYATNSLLWQTYQIGDTNFFQPIYSFLFYLPFVFINDYYSAFAAWLTFVEFAAILVCYFGLKIVDYRWKKNWFFAVLGFVFVLFSYSGVEALIDGNIIMVSIFLFFLGIYFIKREAFELAGVLFAFTTVSIPVFILAYVFLTVWAVKQKVWNLIGWFYGSIFLFGISAALLFPNWLLSFGREWFAYYQTNSPVFLNKTMQAYYPGTSGRLAFFVMGIAAILLLVEWGVQKRRHFQLFYWTLTITMTLSLLLSPSMNVQETAILLPIFFLISAIWGDRWEKRGKIVVVAFWLLLFSYPWLLSLNTGLRADQMRFWQTLPLPILFSVNLYWIRWWLFKNTDLWFDEYSGYNSLGR